MWNLGLDYFRISGKTSNRDDIWDETWMIALLISSSKNDSNINSYLVSQEDAIFSGKSTEKVAKRNAFKSWLLYPVV